MRSLCAMFVLFVLLVGCSKPTEQSQTTASRPTPPPTPAPTSPPPTPEAPITPPSDKQKADKQKADKEKLAPKAADRVKPLSDEEVLELVNSIGGHTYQLPSQPGGLNISIRIDTKDISAAQLKTLNPVKNQLKEITLDCSVFNRVVADAWVTELAPFQYLEAVSFTGPMITADGLKELASLTSLTRLMLISNDLDLASMKAIGNIKTLKKVNLEGCAIEATGLKDLSHLKSLVALNLNGAKVPTADMKELGELTSLQDLNLTQTAINDAGLKVLAPLQNLTSLSLRLTLTSDTELKELAVLKNLTTLDLTGTAVTAAGVKELQQALPKCKINK